MFKGLDLTESQYGAALAAFRQAVEAAGGQKPFADEVRCTQGNISQLLLKGSLLPGRYVLRAEAAFGVDRRALRPDIYPPEPVVDPGYVRPSPPIVAGNRSSKLSLGEPAR